VEAIDGSGIAIDQPRRFHGAILRYEDPAEFLEMS
jgi:hypothetical protein